MGVHRPQNKAAISGRWQDITQVGDIAPWLVRRVKSRTRHCNEYAQRDNHKHALLLAVHGFLPGRCPDEAPKAAGSLTRARLMQVVNFVVVKIQHYGRDHHGDDDKCQQQGRTAPFENTFHDSSPFQIAGLVQV
jgi:hypothetical protein